MTTDRMSRRQQAFRADFRAKIGRAYSGPLHVVLIMAIGFATIFYCARQIGHPAWYEWLVIPVAFCVSNVFEWWIHKYIMHRPVRGGMGIYKRHVLAHHQFFTDAEPTIDSLRDFRIVFFPPYALVAFICLSIPPALILNLAGLPDAGWLVLITNVALYLNYELFHFCCHVKDDSLVRHIPLVNSIRRHHIAHHNPAIMMERNFNLSGCRLVLRHLGSQMRPDRAHLQRVRHRQRAGEHEEGASLRRQHPGGPDTHDPDPYRGGIGEWPRSFRARSRRAAPA